MDFSFSEIILILLIALVVIKPEQLPDVAFSLGRFMKSVRGTFAKMKEEVNGLVESVEKPMVKEVKLIDAASVEVKVNSNERE